MVTSLVMEARSEPDLAKPGDANEQNLDGDSGTFSRGKRPRERFVHDVQQRGTSGHRNHYLAKRGGRRRSRHE